MGYDQPIEGHVESVTRGISDQNATVSTQGLPSVQAVYTWVRLAQRIPVRIRIDAVPEGITLTAGLTATVVVTPVASRTDPAWYDVRHRLAGLLAVR